MALLPEVAAHSLSRGAIRHSKTRNYLGTMANKLEPLIMPDEVRDILAQSKETANSMRWQPKPAAGNAQWMEFTSVCKVQGELREDVIFRASYRGAQTAVHGQAAILLKETYSASLFVGPHRIYGLDNGDTLHTSVIGVGRPYYRKPLSERSHEHLWSDDGEGYAEPVIPALERIDAFMQHFLAQTKLTLNGGFIHPFKGRQIELTV